MCVWLMAMKSPLTLVVKATTCRNTPWFSFVVVASRIYLEFAITLCVVAWILLVFLIESKAAQNMVPNDPSSFNRFLRAKHKRKEARLLVAL